MAQAKQSDIERDDELAASRAHLGRLADAYESLRRFMPTVAWASPQRVAFATALREFGGIFTHSGIRYHPLPDGDFVRARIQGGYGGPHRLSMRPSPRRDDARETNHG